MCSGSFLLLYEVRTLLFGVCLQVDGAKGIEPQTRKLFAVARLKRLPVFTFVNKVGAKSRGSVLSLSQPVWIVKMALLFTWPSLLAQCSAAPSAHALKLRPDGLGCHLQLLNGLHSFCLAGAPPDGPSSSEWV